MNDIAKTLLRFTQSPRLAAHPLMPSTFTTPWRDDAFVYATNRHVMIRIPDASGAIVVPPAKGKQRNTTAKFRMWTEAEGHVWHTLDALDSSAPACTECGGSGLLIACPQAVTGSIFCQEEPCPVCDSNGFLTASPDNPDAEQCPFCCGTNAHLGATVCVSGTHFGTRYIRLLQQTLPAPMLGVAQGDQSAPALVRAGDIMGALMPVRYPGEWAGR